MRNHHIPDQPQNWYYFLLLQLALILGGLLRDISSVLAANGRKFAFAMAGFSMKKSLAYMRDHPGWVGVADFGPEARNRCGELWFASVDALLSGKSAHVRNPAP